MCQDIIGLIWKCTYSHPSLEFKFKLSKLYTKNTIVGMGCSFRGESDLNHVRTNVKSSFPKRNKHHFKNWASNVNVTFIDCVLEKSFSHIYISIYVCIYLWRALFQNMISELSIGIANSSFGLVSIAFWKRALHI